MIHPFFEPLRTGMTGKTVGVGIRTVVFNGFCPRAGYVQDPVAHGCVFGGEGAVEPIRRVARIALLSWNPTIFVMPCGKRSAVGIDHIVDEWCHDMTRRARTDVLRFLKDGGHCAREGYERKNKQSD